MRELRPLAVDGANSVPFETAKFPSFSSPCKCQALDVGPKPDNPVLSSDRMLRSGHLAHRPRHRRSLALRPSDAHIFCLGQHIRRNSSNLWREVRAPGSTSGACSPCWTAP